MADRAVTTVGRLPRGRHNLTREQVEADQRIRILVGMAEAMADEGYVNTPIAEVIRSAGVSRESYYRLFPDKLSGFLAAFDLVGEVLLAEVEASLDGDGGPLERVERAVLGYLETIATNRGYARLFLVESHSAGPEAMSRRWVVQNRLAERLGQELGTRSPAGRFTCEAVVAAVSAMIVPPLVRDDPDAVRALGPAVSGHIRRLHEAGLLA